jgi:hypothetical protein
VKRFAAAASDAAASAANLGFMALPRGNPWTARAYHLRVIYAIVCTSQGTILAGDTYRAFELAPKILAGIVNVNSPTVNDEIHAPMGGVRDSGWGRTGPDSLKEFQDVIWISAHSGQRQYPI